MEFMSIAIYIGFCREFIGLQRALDPSSRTSDLTKCETKNEFFHNSVKITEPCCTKLVSSFGGIFSVCRTVNSKYFDFKKFLKFLF
jgi:hypothetical protein